jgi:hypothetical protein
MGLSSKDKTSRFMYVYRGGGGVPPKLLLALATLTK